MICSIDGCERPKFCKGMCTKHYQRFHTHGSPEFIKIREAGQGTIHHGYKVITVDGKQVPEHRHIMEIYLGRKLLPKEQVHHIDGDTLNNRLDNLKIVTLQTHRVEHAKGYYSGNGSSETHKYCPKCKQVKPRTEFMKIKYPSWCTICNRHYWHKFVKTCPLCIKLGETHSRVS